MIKVKPTPSNIPTTGLKVVISKSNSKLGKIPSFSMSAGVTCLESAWCKDKCYAKKLERIFPNVKKSYETNYVASQDKDFVTTMNSEISKSKATTWRLHVSGDVYNIQYLYNWINIIKTNPTVSFYTYTHSWTNKDMLPHLEILKNLPNMTLFISVDESNRELAKELDNTWRLAFAGNDQIPALKTEFSTNFIQCPQQVKKGITCEKCKYCFNSKLANTTSSVLFQTH